MQHRALLSGVLVDHKAVFRFPQSRVRKTTKTYRVRLPVTDTQQRVWSSDCFLHPPLEPVGYTPLLFSDRLRSSGRGTNMQPRTQAQTYEPNFLRNAGGWVSRSGPGHSLLHGLAEPRHRPV